MVGTAEVNLGYMKSSNDLTTDGETLGGGIGFGASLWRSAGPMLSWGAEISMDNLGSVDATYLDPFTLETVNEEVSAKTIRINPALRLGLGTMVGPNVFVQGGAGLYSVSSKYHYQDTSGASFDADDSSSEFGFNVGAGVGIPVAPKTRMNVQGQYHSVATEGENLNYLALRAGIGFSL
jgi:opacity protein-like surface antigen